VRFVRNHWLSLGQLTVAVVLAVALQHIFTTRADPAAVPQKTWYSVALGEAGAKCDLPKQHTVVFEPCETGPWGVLLSYLPPPVGQGGRQEQQGRYDLKSGKILVCGDMAVLQAGLPTALQPTFRSALRHEYGHAFFSDWMKTKGYRWTEERFAWLRMPGVAADPKKSPKSLRGVVADYLSVTPTVYGLPHFTSTFDEYIAQSYARYVSGKEVPRRTQKFLAKAMGSDGR
jgi:hypothetical protein